MIHSGCESGLCKIYGTPMKELFCGVAEFTNRYRMLKIKSKTVSEPHLQAMKVCRECGGEAPHILRWK
jgi:hypothetical protein